VQVRAKGRYAWTVGWLVASDHALSPGLERWYTQVASTVQVGEPAAVAEARARWTNKPEEPEYRYRLAVELLRAGEPREAHGLVAPLLDRDDGWVWDGMRVALAAWQQEHALELPVGQVVALADEAPGVDLLLLRPAFALLVARGECAAAGRIAAKLGALGREAPEELDADEVATVLEVAGAQRAALEGCGVAAR
jgi:hypothetical protein